MRDHKNLEAFKLADEVAVMVYKITAGYPRSEIYGLTAQMRRAAVSSVSNIVEGCTRISQNEFLRFLEISFGSMKELHYQFNLSFRLGYCDKIVFTQGDKKMDEAEKVLSGLINKVRKK
jgi:four helix bundle protein